MLRLIFLSRTLAQLLFAFPPEIRCWPLLALAIFRPPTLPPSTSSFLHYHEAFYTLLFPLWVGHLLSKPCPFSFHTGFCHLYPFCIWCRPGLPTSLSIVGSCLPDQFQFPLYILYDLCIPSSFLAPIFLLLQSGHLIRFHLLAGFLGLFFPHGTLLLPLSPESLPARYHSSLSVYSLRLPGTPTP